MCRLYFSLIFLRERLYPTRLTFLSELEGEVEAQRSGFLLTHRVSIELLGFRQTITQSEGFSRIVM